MRRQVTSLIIALLLLPMTAFSFLGFGDKPKSLPALKPVTATIKVQTLWTNHAVGNNGSKDSFERFIPVLDEDNLYVSDAKGNVAAVSQKTGQTLWRTNVRVPLASGPAVGDSKVYVASPSSKLVALDAKTGKPLWQAEVPNEVTASPAYGAGTVVVKNIDDNLYAFDTADGKKQWTYEEGAPRLVLQGGSSPVVFDTIVLAGFSDAKMAVINLSNGKLLWQAIVAEPNGISELSRMIDINATPVIDKGTVYVASYQGDIAALDLRTSKLLWTHKISSYTGAAVSDDKVFVTDTQGYVWAFDRKTGKVAWRQMQLKERKLTRPAVVGDYVVIADAEGMVHWLAASDGHFVARQWVNKVGFVADPISDGETVYLQSRDGSVTADRITS